MNFKNLKERQIKARRDQKKLGIGLALVVTVAALVAGQDNTIWLNLAIMYDVSVALVIGYELWDEARVRGWMQEYYYDTVRAESDYEPSTFIGDNGEPLMHVQKEETAKIDIIV